jgi:hypothetical protein
MPTVAVVMSAFTPSKKVELINGVQVIISASKGVINNESEHPTTRSFFWLQRPLCLVHGFGRSAMTGEGNTLHGVPPGTGSSRKPVGAPWVRGGGTSGHQTAQR